jgi:large subunit ribosomal protein L17
MRHRNDTIKLSRSHSHRRALVSNMVTSLFRHEKIKTTFPKAQVVKREAERLITIAKRNDLAAQRLAVRVVKDKDVLKKLFQVIAPRMKDKASGCVTVTKLWVRKGDAALLCVMELFGAPAKVKATEGEKKEAKKQPAFKKKGEKRAEGKKEDKKAEKSKKEEKK